MSTPYPGENDHLYEEERLELALKHGIEFSRALKVDSYGNVIPPDYLNGKDPNPAKAYGFGRTMSCKMCSCDLCDEMCYCSKYDSSNLFLCPNCNREKYESERTPAYMTPQGTYHMKFKLTGEEAYKELFYGIASECDSDWPILPTRKPTDKIDACATCGGFIYNNPHLPTEALKRLAVQCGLKIKIKSWLHFGKCKGGRIQVPVPF